jgi:3-deoxy-D-manno-octulosonic-acid transferase
MFILYNILQLCFLLVFFPLLTLFVALSDKYRDRIPARLGRGLIKKIGMEKRQFKTIWLHALSVGEVTSAVPLVSGLRQRYPAATIIVSVTTRTGRKVADDLLGKTADRIIDGPLDLLPVVRRFIRQIHPDLFILVETDFWPNILICLKRHGIPAILVNGRVSQKSMTRYRRLRFFFRPMFQCFSFLCMQTEGDRDKMVLLGISPEKLPPLGNLKFATPAAGGNGSLAIKAGFLPKNRIVFIAGSTHPGEEQIVLDSYARLRDSYPELFLVIAPRDPTRAEEVGALAAARGLTVALRSAGTFQPADIFILDTIGELIDFYALAHLAFVGGSLVKKGGHNPIEPAAMAIPVLFGPNMEDFSEIADTLIKEGGALEIRDLQQLTKALTDLLDTPDHRSRMGQAARRCVLRQHDIIAKHLLLIDKLL